MSSAAIDLERARAETPGTRHRVHLDNCSAALMPGAVIEAVRAHLELEAQCGATEAAERADARVEHVYDALARLLGCSREEVAVVENATRAWDMAFYAFDFGPGDRILTAMAEYASNYIAYLQVARRTGAVVEVVPDDASGQLDVAALERMIDSRVKLVSVTHVPTNGGLVNPAERIGAVTRAHGVPFLLDACQSAGQMPLDVEALGVDMLSATGRKYLRGPRGTGFLYVRRELIERLQPSFLDLHAAVWTAPGRYELRRDARRFETFECNVAAKIGLGAAVDYALGWGLDAIEARVGGLAERLRAGLAEIPGATVHDLGRRRCGIVSFSIEGQEPGRVQAALAARRINVSTSTANGTRLDMERRGLASVLRAGVHYYNTEEELETLVAALADLRRSPGARPPRSGA